jgi:hypothetical protein
MVFKSKRRQATSKASGTESQPVPFSLPKKAVTMPKMAPANPNSVPEAVVRCVASVAIPP